MTQAVRGAAVVGAGPGLGRELALVLAAEGYDVALVGRRSEPVESIASGVRAAGGRAEALVADAEDPSALAALLRERDSRVPTQVLSYNAVARSEDTLTLVPTGALRAALDVNVVSAVAAVQAVLPSLVAARGVVLVTGGGSALHPRAPYGVLSVGKAAVRAAAYALADELAPRGVRVRTLTIAGLIAPKGPFDPAHVAKTLWTMRDGDDVELVYTG
jgi:short-subunit dehydrogenase